MQNQTKNQETLSNPLEIPDTQCNSQLSTQLKIKTASVSSAIKPALKILFRKKVHLVIGPSGSGKTYLVSKLIKYSGYNRENTVIVSPTFYAQEKPVRDSFEGCLLFNKYLENLNFDKFHHKLFIFDDIGNAMKFNESFTRLLINKRHTRNCIIVLIQYHTFITTVLRNNYEYVYVFKFNNFDMRENIWKGFLINFFSNKKKAFEFINSLNKYEFFLSDQTNLIKAKIKK